MNRLPVRAYCGGNWHLGAIWKILRSHSSVILPYCDVALWRHLMEEWDYLATLRAFPASPLPRAARRLTSAETDRLISVRVPVEGDRRRRPAGRRALGH